MPSIEEPALYLLDLPGCDREKVESRLFQEDGFSEILEAAERDLLDSYARSTLPEDLRSRVETKLLCNERQLDKLRVARMLVRGQQRPRYKWTVGAVAATLLITAAGVSYFHGTLAPRHRSHEPAIATYAKPVPHGGPAIVSTFLLTPGVSRGRNLQQIAIAGKTDMVHLELADADGTQTYKARLTGASGSVVWEKDDLRARDAGIEIVLPANLLHPGRFRIVLTGDPPLSYYFQVASRPFGIQRESSPVERVGPGAR